MVHTSQRTTGCLALTATIFIIVIIVLCVIPSKPGKTVKDSPKSQQNSWDVITDATSTSTTSSTKAPTDTPTEIPTISTTASTTTTDKGLEASTRSTSTSTSTTSTSTSTSTSTTSTSTSTSTSTASTTTSTSTTDNSQKASTSSTSTETSTISTITSTSTTNNLVEADSTDASTETSTTSTTASTSTTDNLVEADSTDAPTETSTTSTTASTSTTDNLEDANSTDASTETSTTSTTASPSTTETSTTSTTASTSTTDNLEDADSTDAPTETSTTSTTAPTSTTDNLEDADSTDAPTSTSTTSTITSTSTTNNLEDADSTDASTETSTTSTTASTSTTKTSTTSTTASTSTTDNLVEADSTDASTEASTTSTTISPPTIVKGTSDACTTPDCKNFASRMLHLMDHRGAPCKDFYHYACGSLERDDFLLAEDPQQPADKMIQNILSTLPMNHPTEQLQLYYKSCLNYIQNSNETQRRLEAANLVKEIGYPVSIYNFYMENTTKALATLMMLQFSPIVDVKLDIDGSDNTKFAISLTPPVTESVFSDNQAKAHCLSKYNTEEERARRENNVLDIDQAYENYKACMENDGLYSEIETMIESLDFFGLDDHFNSEIEAEMQTRSRDAGNQNVSYLRHEFLDEMRQSIREILLILRKDVPSCRLQIARKEYEERALYELDSMIDGDIIVWEELMRELLGQEVDPNTKVQIYCKDQLSNVFDMLEEIYNNSTRAFPNMLAYLWSGRVYSDFISPTGKTLSSKEYCFDATKVLLDDLVSFSYLQELPNEPYLQQKIENMVANLSEIAEEQLDWMYLSSAPHSDLLTNVRSLSVEGIDKTALEEDTLKTSLTVNMTSDDFLGNSQALLRRYGQRRFGFFDKTPEEENIKWKQFTLPHAARGITLYGPNTLLVPYASLAPPLLYDQNLPSFVNFGGFGHLIAQEMMEKLDITGVKEGSKHSDRYKNLSHCLEEQLELPQNTSTDGLLMNFTLNSKLFIYDVLADSAATRLALDTFTESPQNERMQWMEEMTPQQLFFLRVAQSQCASNARMSMLDVKEDINLPPQLRVNLVLRNEPNFQSAFHCPQESPMVAETQCPFTLPVEL